MVPVSFLLGVGGNAGAHGGTAKASEGSWGKSVIFAFLKELSERAWLGNIFCAAHLPALGKAWSPASRGVPATPGREEEEGQQALGKGSWSWGAFCAMAGTGGAGPYGKAVLGSLAPVGTPVPLFPGALGRLLLEPGTDPQCPGSLPARSNHRAPELPPLQRALLLFIAHLFGRFHTFSIEAYKPTEEREEGKR